MTALAELIARLEVATAGSRELDIAVYEAIGWRRKQFSKTAPTWLCPPDDGKRIAIEPFNLLPCVTTSIDAALTLVPEGWYLTCLAEVGCGHFYDWAATICDHLEGRVEDGDWRSAPGQTPALALCIATVKAREARP